jgi:hypothetical protein
MLTTTFFSFVAAVLCLIQLAAGYTCTSAQGCAVASDAQQLLQVVQHSEPGKEIGLNDHEKPIFSKIDKIDVTESIAEVLSSDPLHLRRSHASAASANNSADNNSSSEPLEEPKQCADWCNKDDNKGWQTAVGFPRQDSPKCEWKSCNGCDECKAPVQPPEPAPVPAPQKPWPECQRKAVRIKSGPEEDLFADLVDYGATDGCKDSDCSDTDEMIVADEARCALICATTTNCKFWTFGPEASNMKCWLRTGNARVTTIAAEADDYVTGTRGCTPPADNSASFSHPPTAEVVTFYGQRCSSGADGLFGKDFLRLGTGADGKSFFYSKELEKWLYYAGCAKKAWVMTDELPASRNLCEADAWAYSGEMGDFGGPGSSKWTVDCGGASKETLSMRLVKQGVKAEFWKAEGHKDFSVKVEPDVKRIDPRIDYWLTTRGWDDLPTDMMQGFYALWTGYIKIQTPGDYEFTVGSSDNAQLKWYVPKSDSWATFEHQVSFDKLSC